MKAVILVGGFGTRLKPLSISTPKAMMPVINTPFLEYVIRRLVQHNIRQIVLAISHLAEPIESYLGDGSRFGANLTYTIEDTALGTAGAVKNAEKYLNEAFFILNGDIFTDLDLTAMMTFHVQRKSLITIALTPVDDPTHYGLIETDTRNRISSFLEKPRWDQVTTNMINAGTYILEPEVLANIPPQKKFSFERQVFPPLLEQRESIYAYPSSYYWIDIGTPRKYQQLNRDLLNGKSNQYAYKAESDHSGADIIQPLVVGDNCEIGGNTKLAGPLVIGPGSSIASNAVIEDCVIWNDVAIEAGAVVKHSIIGNKCHIGSGSIIGNSVIADNVTIADGYQLEPGSNIWPDTRLG
ncbi:sugar phosphate nucleotidyltransferase [Chloroflexota bacterium]